MRRALVLAALAGCYEPSLAPCTVRCDSAAPCPDNMTCGGDEYCHASGDEEACTSGNVFTIEIRKSGSGSGTVTSTRGVDCGTDCIAAVTGGTEVVLETSAESGSRFAGFNSECAGKDPCTVVVNSDKVITATFNRASTLTVTFIGPGLGRVASTPPGIDCTTTDVSCIADFDLGADVMLRATPDVDFFGWSGDCVDAGFSLECTLTIDGPKEVGVEFAP